MLEIDEVTSEWSVLLSLADPETMRLLSVVLDGFGYAPLECGDSKSVFELLSRTTPFAALVDLQIEDSTEICSLIREHGGIRLLILLGDDEPDPGKQQERLQADGWESVRAEPERLLLALRKLANQQGG